MTRESRQQASEERLFGLLSKANVQRGTPRVAFQLGEERWYRLVVAGTEAVSTWERLAALTPQTGLWPLLVGPDEDVELLLRFRSENRQQEKTLLRNALRIQAEAWFDHMHRAHIQSLRESLADIKQYYREHPDAEDSDSAHYRNLLQRRGRYQGIPRGERSDWPPDDTDLVTVYNFKPEPLAEVHLLLVPSKQSWRIPIAVRLGSWNACPSPEEHAAVLRNWEERFQAEIIGIHYDILELRVQRPPRGWRAALQLAREQYIYCEDIVDQGTRTLERLAESLINANYWYFWWD